MHVLINSIKQNMNKLHIVFLFFLASMILQSCSTEVDLFADGAESTIVYAMLNPGIDTNYVKITKSFTGNVNENAQNYNLSNYDYKLNAGLVNIRTNDTIPLDTVSLYKPYDSNTPFYNDCQQLYYYTTRDLHDGDLYKLVIKKKDGSVISSEAKIISEFIYASNNTTNTISFESKVSNVSNQIRWRYDDPIGATKAAYYEVIGYFHYKQLNYGSEDTMYYSMKWNMGAGTYDDLITDIFLHTTHTPIEFYSRLASDPNIRNNSPQGVRRYFGDFEVVITAVGDELYEYMLANNSSSAIQDTPEYSNIENGIGLMSSRFILTKYLTVADNTKTNLEKNYPQWGFDDEIPN